MSAGAEDVDDARIITVAQWRLLPNVGLLYPLNPTATRPLQVEFQLIEFTAQGAPVGFERLSHEEGALPNLGE